MGSLISKLLFQPPDPPSYKDSSKLLWLTCPKRVGEKVPTLIPAVFLKHPKSDQVILYSHGNATDLGQMMPYLELLRSSLKINVFSYEYQGYGLTKPKRKPTEQRCYDSIIAAHRYLVEQLNIKSENIIVFGTSLGTGPSVYLTANEKYNFRGLILQSPFTSVVRIKVKVSNKMFFDMFPNIDRIQRVRCPTFIIHGKVDEVVPFEHAEILSTKIREDLKYKPLYIDYAGHNNIMEIMSVERYIKKLYEYIQYLNQYHIEKQKNSTIQAFQGEKNENGIEQKHKSVPTITEKVTEKEKRLSSKSTK